MFLGDVRGKAISRHPLPAEPAEGLAGRDVDALHSPNSMSGSLFARQAQPGVQAPVVGKRISITRHGWKSDRSHPLRIFSRHSIFYNRSQLPWPSLLALASVRMRSLPKSGWEAWVRCGAPPIRTLVGRLRSKSSPTPLPRIPTGWHASSAKPRR
jgi:hypothetical protein